MAQQLQQLREKHPVFHYQGFESEIHPQVSGSSAPATLHISFSYLLEPDIRFSPQLSIPLPSAGLDELAVSEAELQDLIFHLGLIELISYWKASCSPLISIEAGELDDWQQGWWLDLYQKGLGEFYYRNEIDFTQADFLNLVVEKPAPEAERAISIPSTPTPKTPDPRKILLPIGGGKDSLLSLDLLMQNGQLQPTLMTLGSYPSVSGIAALHPELPQLRVERKIDPQLIELNQNGYLNGHTPFSAYLSFLTVFLARLHNLDTVLLSNESSANEANTSYKGQEINHQYSKSLDYEERFQEYQARYFPRNPRYYSLLRPLNELQIGRAFAKRALDQRYGHVFSSCNRFQKQGAWCQDCPKCLFAYLMLFPFLGFERIGAIFSEDLLDKKSLLPDAACLVELDKSKPWECVGTKDESLAALELSRRLYLEAGLPLPHILQALSATLDSQGEDVLKALIKKSLNAWEEHRLPPELAVITKKALHA